MIPSPETNFSSRVLHLPPHVHATRQGLLSRMNSTPLIVEHTGVIDGYVHLDSGIYNAADQVGIRTGLAVPTSRPN